MTREEAIAELQTRLTLIDKCYPEITDCRDALKMAIEALEQQKTGHWIEFDRPWWQCSECGAVRENKTFMENFCPNCGADMRGEK